MLARLGGDEFAWQVPALREELVTALIRSLPKDLRRNFVPAPDTARAVLAAIEPGAEPLLDALQRELRRRTGVLVPIDAFDLDKLPAHLRVTFVVESRRRRRGGARQGSRRHCRSGSPRRAARAVAEAVAGELERTRAAHLARRPRRTAAQRRAHQRRAHRARLSRRCVDAGAAVDVRVFATTAEQDAAMASGHPPAASAGVPSPVKAVERQLDPRTRLVLGTNPDGSLAALLDDCADAAADALVPAPAWTRDEFAALRDRVAARARADDPRRRRPGREGARRRPRGASWRCPTNPPPAQADAIADIRAQLDRLLPVGFVTATGAAGLADLTRYLTAIGRRLDRLPRGRGRDRQRMQRVHAVQDAYDELVGALSPSRAAAADVRDIALADRGTAGQPVGAAARHSAAGQRAAHLPRDRPGTGPMRKGHP